jgi:sialic acid synthase SpsE
MIDLDFAESEIDARINARRSLVSLQAINKDSLFSADLVTAKRPGTGIEPWRIDQLLGKRFARKIGQDEVIYPDDFY